MVNCVSASAATQYIEAPINVNNDYPINQSRFCCQDYFFLLAMQPGADITAQPLVGFDHAEPQIILFITLKIILSST